MENGGCGGSCWIWRMHGKMVVWDLRTWSRDMWGRTLATYACVPWGVYSSEARHGDLEEQKPISPWLQSRRNLSLLCVKHRRKRCSSSWSGTSSPKKLAVCLFYRISCLASLLDEMQSVAYSVWVVISMFDSVVALNDMSFIRGMELVFLLIRSLTMFH